LKKILIAYDGSEPAKAAMNFAFEIARYFDSDMHVIAVCQLPEFGGEVEMQDFVARTQTYFNQMLRSLKKQYPQLKNEMKYHVAMGHPAEQILRYADKHEIDHIVVGHRGRTLFSRWTLGSVAKQIVEHALCPVTVIRK